MKPLFWFHLPDLPGVSILTGSGEPVKQRSFVVKVSGVPVSILTGSGEPVKQSRAVPVGTVPKFQSSPAPENR